MSYYNITEVVKLILGNDVIQEGSAYEESDYIIYTDGTPNTTVILSSLDGQFSGTALLNGYKDSIVICVNDLYGRQYYDTINVNYFGTPTIKILSPDTYAHDTNSTLIWISGTTEESQVGDTGVRVDTTMVI